MNEFIEKIEYQEEKVKQKISINEIIKTAYLILKMKTGVTQEDTIIVVSNSKIKAFNARINFMKRTHQENMIDMFDLAGQSKRRLTVFPRGEKYERTRR